MTQATLIQSLQTAAGHHRSGRLSEAETLCRQILAEMPRQPGALHLLALIARQSGQTAVGVTLLQRAVEANPADAELHCHLGIFLRETGRGEQAFAAFSRAVTLNPNLAEAHANLGDLLGARGRDEEAAGAFERVVALKPEFAAAWNNYGIVLRRQTKFAQAAEAFERAAALHPDGLARILTNLGNVLVDTDRWDEALEKFERVVALSPNYAIGWNNLGLALQRKERLSDAWTALNRAAALQPDLAEAHVNLGNVLHRMNRSEEALTAYGRALRLKTDLADAWNGHGVVLHELGRFQEAKQNYEQAIAIQPDLAAGHFSLATLLLLHGEFTAGWAEYEWRTQCAKPRAAARFAQPAWRGEDLTGKTILLYPEQGLGDMIQFIRYAPLLADRGGRVIVESRPPLARLMGTVRGVEQVVTEGTPLPSFDVHAPILSLPRLFETVLETIPAQIPYLSADADAAGRWRARLVEDGPGFRVGLCWAGNPEHIDDRARSIPLSALEPLLQTPGVIFYSLQKGTAARDAGELRNVGLIDHTAELDDFLDTAALVAHLDLIISVDTAVAHLAGAMGKPVWVLLKKTPDFRWMLGRSDSPWYPTMRLFRQENRGDWNGVIKEVSQALVRNP